MPALLPENHDHCPEKSDQDLEISSSLPVANQGIEERLGIADATSKHQVQSTEDKGCGPWLPSLKRQFVDDEQTQSPRPEKSSHISNPLRLTTVNSVRSQTSSGDQENLTESNNPIVGPGQDISTNLNTSPPQLDNNVFMEPCGSPDISNDEEEEYTVDEILNSRYHNHSWQYRVSWVDHPPDSLWYPEKNFSKCQQLIIAFHQKRSSQFVKNHNDITKSTNGETMNQDTTTSNNLDDSTGESTDEDYIDKSDSGPVRTTKRPRSVSTRSARRSLRRSKKIQDSPIQLTGTDDGPLPETKLSIQGEPIPIRGALTLMTHNGKIVYSVAFSQESINDLLDEKQRYEAPSSSEVTASADKLYKSKGQACQSSQKKRPKVPIDKELLRRLKEDDDLSWDDITKSFPENSKNSLQASYSVQKRKRQCSKKT